MTLYAAGLRLSEAANLTIRDIDGQRMQLNVQSGKGKKQRQVPLSPRLLEALREYWKQYRPQKLLFPGKTPEKPYAGTSIQKTIKASARRAGISKNVTPHTLRHSYATGLLEAGVDIAYDQPAAGPFEFHHHDGLSACPANTLSPLTEPARLAADPATAQVGRSQPTQRPDRTATTPGQRPAQS